MLLTKWHLNVETLLGIVLGKGLEIEHGAVILLVVFRARLRVSTNDLLWVARFDRAVFADEASVVLNYSEALLTKLELEFD